MYLVTHLSIFLQCLLILGNLVNSSNPDEKSLPGNKVKVEPKNEILNPIPVYDSVTFFTDSFAFETASYPKALNVQGKYISSSSISEIDDEFQMDLLDECSNFIYDLVELNDETKINRRKAQFVKRLEAFLSKSKPKKPGLIRTLLNRHCEHAILSCGSEDFNQSFLKTFFLTFPNVAKNHLFLFGGLEDYSFLTIELVNIYYEIENAVMTPFILKRLVEIVPLKVLIHLLEKWNYDLRYDDAVNVIEAWGSNNEFLTEVEQDSRSWLLWRNANIQKLFPVQMFLEDIESFDAIPSIYHFGNLILSFIWESEIGMTTSFTQMEYINAYLHQNDVLQEQFMTPEIIANMNARKHEIWIERSEYQRNLINSLMKNRIALIEKLKSFQLDEAKPSEVGEQAFISQLIELSSIPFHNFNRMTYLKSRDNFQLEEARNNYSNYWFGPTSFPIAYNLKNENLWTILWDQLEKTFGVEYAYDKKFSEKYENFSDLFDLITNLAHNFAKFQIPEKYFNCIWFSRILISFVSPSRLDLENSQAFIKSLRILNKISPLDLEDLGIDALNQILHPESNEDIVFELTHGTFDAEAYLFAPKFLSREGINYLLRDTEAREKILKKEPLNIMKLRYLNDFRAEDFIEFFGIGSNMLLENHAALYTADPSALADYYKAVDGVCNKSEQLIRWVHPRAFQNHKFTDAISLTIPFSYFINHPNESVDYNLAFIINDIVGRLKRNSAECPHKLILKWLMNFEWLFFDFNNYHFIELIDMKGYPNQCFANLLKTFKDSKVKLIEWLNSSGNISVLEDKVSILRLIEWIPLSYLRASDHYEYFLIEKTNSPFHPLIISPIKNRFSGYQYFSSKLPSVLTLNEVKDNVTVSLNICNELVIRYFSTIEKQIWLNRMKIFSLPVIYKNGYCKVPKSFAFSLISEGKSPINDVKVFYNFLDRSGKGHFVRNKGLDNPDSDVLGTLQAHSLGQKTSATAFENFVFNKRMILAKSHTDMMKAKKSSEKLEA